MVQRVRNSERMIPCGNLVLAIFNNFPTRYSLSATGNNYEKWKKKVEKKGKTVNQAVEKWFLNELIGVKDWKDFHKEYPIFCKKLNRKIKELIDDHIGGLDTTSLSAEFNKMLISSLEEDNENN